MKHRKIIHFLLILKRIELNDIEMNQIIEKLTFDCDAYLQHVGYDGNRRVAAKPR